MRFAWLWSWFEVTGTCHEARHVPPNWNRILAPVESKPAFASATITPVLPITLSIQDAFIHSLVSGSKHDCFGKTDLYFPSK